MNTMAMMNFDLCFDPLYDIMSLYDGGLQGAGLYYFQGDDHLCVEW